MDSASMLKLGLEEVVSGLILVLVIYPFVLSATNRLANGFWSSYGRTLATVVVAGVVASIINYVITRMAGHGDIWLLRIVSIIVTLLVGGAVMNALVRHKDGAPLGFGRAALACLVLGIVVVLISFGLSPWQKGLAKKIRARVPAHAVVSPAPAVTTTVAVSVSSTAAAASKVPAAAVATSVPATASSTH